MGLSGFNRARELKAAQEELTSQAETAKTKKTRGRKAAQKAITEEATLYGDPMAIAEDIVAKLNDEPQEKE